MHQGKKRGDMLRKEVLFKLPHPGVVVLLANLPPPPTTTTTTATYSPSPPSWSSSECLSGHLEYP